MTYRQQLERERRKYSIENMRNCVFFHWPFRAKICNRFNDHTYINIYLYINPSDKQNKYFYVLNVYILLRFFSSFLSFIHWIILPKFLSHSKLNVLQMAYGPTDGIGGHDSSLNNNNINNYLCNRVQSLTNLDPTRSEK